MNKLSLIDPEPASMYVPTHIQWLLLTSFLVNVFLHQLTVDLITENVSKPQVLTLTATQAHGSADRETGRHRLQIRKSNVLRKWKGLEGED